MKDVVGYEGLYAVTSCGRVWSYKSKRFLKAFPIQVGYLMVCLCDNKKKENKYVHRLVAEAYIPNPNNYATVDHIDGNKLNNCVNNLQWMSIIDNLIKSCPEKAPIRVRCVETNEEFRSIADCTRKTGLDYRNLSNHLRGLLGSVSGLHFEIIEE